MGTLNVKIPDEMEEELTRYMADNPGYMNRSELVRDALRHLVGQATPSAPRFSAYSIPGITPEKMYSAVSSRAQEQLTARGIEESEVEDAIKWARENPDPWANTDRE